MKLVAQPTFWLTQLPDRFEALFFNSLSLSMEKNDDIIVNKNLFLIACLMKYRLNERRMLYPDVAEH